ncbi:hypothetical protein MMC17_009375 [Xylographa soralifera]|nr:hypothetical protein [Xylographa soralifera]
MPSSTDSFVEHLLARRIVNGRIITIPGFPNLNESQQAQVIARLQQEEREGMIRPAFDPKTLEDALSNLTRFRKGASAAVATEPLIDSRDPTPPPRSKEALFIEAQGYEIKARQDLEAEGCPPCYPPNLEIPLRDIPEEYQGIISYWQLFSSQDNVELLAQYRDWERFREFQKRVRHDYGTSKTPFSEYVDRVRKRRQSHGLGGDVPLRFSLEEKDPSMDRLQKKADSSNATVSKRAAEVLEFNQPVWKHSEHELEMERYFLQWTEQKRMAMDPGYLTAVEVDRNDWDTLSKAVRKASVPKRRKRQPKARSVLGKPGISKRKQDVLRKKPKKPDTAPKPSPPAIDFSPPVSNVSRIPDSPAVKPRRLESQTPRRQLPPQKVFKAKRFENTNVKSAAASPRRANGQR